VGAYSVNKPDCVPCVRCSYSLDSEMRDLLLGVLWRHETVTCCTKRIGRHASRTAEQRTQHGSQSVEGRLAEEGSTTQASQRKQAGREETRFLAPRNLSRLLETYP
jgi:hypothetical protein